MTHADKNKEIDGFSPLNGNLLFPIFQNTGSSLVHAVFSFLIVCLDSSGKLSRVPVSFDVGSMVALPSPPATIMTHPRSCFQCLGILSKASSN